MSKFVMAICSVFIAIQSIAQSKVDILDYKGDEVQFIISKTNENTFSKFFTIQYEHTKNVNFLNDLSGFQLISVNNRGIILSASNGRQLTFSISESSNPNLLGYGFSHYEGNFKLVTEGTTKYILDVNTGSKKKPKDFDCDSGGEGSSGCSTEGGIGTINTGCSVTCNTGYYACCDQGKNECKCFNSVTGEPYPELVEMVTYYSY